MSIISDKAVKDLYAIAYDQGINHALKYAKIVAKRNHTTIEAFLLDLSLELAKLKIEMNHSEEGDAHA